MADDKPMSEGMKDMMALSQERTAQSLASYLARGRHLQHFTLDELRDRWVGLQNSGHRSQPGIPLPDRECEDIATECDLRGVLLHNEETFRRTEQSQQRLDTGLLGAIANPSETGKQDLEQLGKQLKGASRRKPH